MHELPLLIFTLMSQFAIGTYLVLLIYSVKKSENSYQLFKSEFRVITVLIVLSGLFSLFHLGSPLRAINLLNNIGSSWLSREAISFGLFSGFFFINMFLCIKEASPSLIKFTAAAAALSGVLMLFCMSKLYMLPTIPVWNNAHTPVSFFAASLVFGGFYILIKINSNKDLVNFEKKHLFVLILLLLVILVNELHFGLAVNVKPELNAAIILRVLLLIAVFIPTITFYQNNSGEVEAKQLQRIFFLAIIGEIIGRFIFYGSFYSIGL